MNKKETRSLPSVYSCVYRDTDKAGNSGQICRGMGIIYNTEVEIWDGYFETINIGAFTETLTSGDEVHSYFNHNPNYILSKTTSDPPLTLEDTDEGLIFNSPIPNTTYGQDLKENLKNGNIRGASFSFTVDDGGEIWSRDEDGNLHRTITKGTLYEVGPVTNPAYDMTAVELNSRSKDDILAAAEKVLSDVKVDKDVEYKNWSEINRNKIKYFERNK